MSGYSSRRLGAGGASMPCAGISRTSRGYWCLRCPCNETFARSGCCAPGRSLQEVCAVSWFGWHVAGVPRGKGTYYGASCLRTLWCSSVAAARRVWPRVRLTWYRANARQNGLLSFSEMSWISESCLPGLLMVSIFRGRCRTRDRICGRVGRLRPSLREARPDDISDR